MSQSDDVQSNVIDLQERLARVRAGVIADDVAAATAELQGLRTALRTLNLILELNDVADTPLLNNEQLHRALDEITAQLLHFMEILRIPPSQP